MSSRQPAIRYWRSDCGDWRWHLRAANGEIVAAGEGYVTRAGVLAGIAAMRRNAARAVVREVERIKGPAMVR